MNKGRIITAMAALLALPAMAAPAGYFQVPGTETTMKIYGYAQADGVFDLKGNYGMDNGLNTPYNVHQSWKFKNQWHWRAKGRFGFTTTTPSALGEVTMKVEFQAVDNGSEAKREKGIHGDIPWTAAEEEYTSETSDNVVKMRHCYGTIGNLTIGKTDSIFADWDASPNYIDNDGMLGDFYGNGRVNQVSYKYEFTKGLLGQIAIERDATSSNNRYFPGALVVALGYTGDWGHVRGAVAFAKHKWTVQSPLKPTIVMGDHDNDTTTPDVPVGVVRMDRKTRSKNSVSWGLGANFYVFDKKGNITAQVFDGVGFYGAGSIDDYAMEYKTRYDHDLDQYVYTGDWKIEHQRALGWTLGYSHQVTDTVTLAAGLGETKWKKDKNVEFATSKIGCFFINAQWQATKTASFAFEYFYARAKFNGYRPYVNTSYDAKSSTKESRINLRAKFNFF